MNCLNMTCSHILYDTLLLMIFSIFILKASLYAVLTQSEHVCGRLYLTDGMFHLKTDFQRQHIFVKCSTRDNKSCIVMLKTRLKLFIGLL
jgi:hypothetical protein